MGVLIGSIIGYKVGSWPGLILGAWLGQWIDKLISQPARNAGRKQTQESFFNALFLTMGKLAKADGEVSALEIERTEGIIQHMKLTQEMRARAIDLFGQGKQAHYSIDSALRQFGRLSRRSLSLKQIFLEMLVDVAEADGVISPEEQRLIEQVCHAIAYPQQLLHAMLKMRGFRAGGAYQYDNSREYRHQQKHTPNTQASYNPYQVLGVGQSENKATIRRAYKKLMSQHHPDKLVSKGLPPEMMQVAEEKTKQVQMAWEKVKDLKGW